MKNFHAGQVEKNQLDIIFPIDRRVLLGYSVFIKGIERPFDKGVHLHFTPFPSKYLKCRKSEMQTWKLNLLSGLYLIV